ncbi:MAG: VWA domain-containing protein, partial [Planctomycetes bacterium]|nr:VWA domain-containing protein [Planctomycetota bacterium]
LKSDLGKLEIDLLSAPRVEGSLPYALPMPESLGVEAPWPQEDLEHKVEDLLWNIPAEKWEENWAALKKWAQVDPAANDDLLRVQVDSILLDKAAADPDKGLETACKLVKFLDRGIKPRPAEAHFMVMLQRDMNRQPPPPANLRKLVLETRRLAEQVALSARGDARTPGASYSEKILPWTQAAVQAADAKRRPGEDQVFLSNDQGWTEAATLLNDAHDRYQKLQPTVAALREALNTYHEVLAALPYDSLWLARREGTDDRKLQANEKLWGDVHALADLLEDRQKTPDPNQIAVLTRDLQGEFKELTTEFQQEGQSLRDASATPGNLRRLQDVLVSPLIPADLRVRLVEKSREISRKLAEENKATGDTAAEPDAQALSDQQARALQAGVRQGRLALAVLGSTWVGPDYAPLSKKVREQSFAEVEEPLRQQWWRLLDEVQKRTASAANAPPNLAAGDLASAEHLARSMDGATVRFLDRDPVADNRRLLLHNLLVNQAERTVHDHWFAEQGKPYYQVAAGMDLRDAADLIGANRTDLDEDQKKVRLEAVARVEKMLGKDQPGVLQVDGLKEQSVTSQLSFDVKYTLSAQPGVQPGYPVAWCDLETPLAFLRPEDARRQRLEIAADRQGLKVLPQPVIAFTMKTPPEAAQAGATLHVRYRGQVIDFPTDVYMFSEPDVIAYEDTPRDKAAIAVRANEDFEGQGALAIVLDCSGSMNVPSKAGGETKFNEALDALQEVLQTIPRGTKVGVWIFGQKENEGVIQQLQAPDTWDPENNFGQLKRLMQKLRAITPYYETPLVKGIVTAKDALLDMRGLKGIKSMLVLTDGMDTEFKPQNRIGAYLKEQFVDTDIFVNMVFYKFDPPEDQAKAIAQFEAIRDLDVPGQLFQETDASKLAATMLQALRPKLRLEVNGALPRGVPKQGIDISLQRDDHLFWSPPLFPDDYTPRLASFRNLPDLLLQAGDRLVLSVTPKGLQRVLYGKSFFADSRISSEGLQAGGGSDPGSSSQPWLLSTLQNQLGPNNRSLQMMMTLENQAQLSPAAGESLQQIRPRFVWFEVSAPDTGPKGKGAQPRGIRWGNLADYPAPAWGLDVRQWPSGAQPLLQAWWRSDQAPYPLAEFKREDPARPIDQVFKDMDLPPGVHSLDVTVEQQQVAGEDNPRPCLVVRIKYDPDTPILALTSGLPLQRREHRFYYQAGQYTGLFWPTTAEQLTRARFTLSLISLKDFKDKAQAQNAYIKMPLPPPDHRARPEPVLLPGQ